MLDKICGTCRFHRQDDNFEEDYICCNDASDMCADWTAYDDSCDQWEGKENDLLKKMEQRLGDK